jgi:hypothetical protein
MDKIVTIDFDGTLTKPEVQDYVKELMKRGIDVWIVTSRFDDLQKHRYPHNPTNEDLWQVVDSIGIPRYKVRFMCMESKANYLRFTNSFFHLDDDDVEYMDLVTDDLNRTVPVDVKDINWKIKCEGMFEPGYYRCNVCKDSGAVKTGENEYSTCPCVDDERN